MKNPNYGVGYCRYSSENQREESITAQQREISHYAEQQDIHILGWYIDRATTGTTADRAEWQRLVSDSKNGHFGIVLVHKENRFSRQKVGEQYNEENRLKENGVKLLSVTERYDNNPSGRMAKGFNRVVNSWFSDNLSQEVIKGMKENIYSGKNNGGRTPYGYKSIPLRDEKGDFLLNKKNKVIKQISICPHQSEAVKIMFDMAINGSTREQIIKRLKELGYKRNDGHFFGGTSIDNVLRNPKYAGIYSMTFNLRSLDYDPETISNEDGYPAIISKDVFETVQKMLSRRKHTPRGGAIEQYLLTGKIFCGECGKEYHGTRIRRGKYLYYKCSCQQTHKNGIRHENYCNNNSVQKDATEQYVLSQVQGILSNDHIIDDTLFEYNRFESEFSCNDEIIAMLEKEVKRLEKEIYNVTEAIVSSGNNPFLVERLKTLTQDLAISKDNLAREKRTEKYSFAKRHEIEKVYQNARHILEHGTHEERKAMLHNFINKIFVHKGKVDIYLNIVPMMLCGSLNLEIYGKQNLEFLSLADFVPKGKVSVDEKGVYMGKEMRKNKENACNLDEQGYRQESLWYTLGDSNPGPTD